MENDSPATPPQPPPPSDSGGVPAESRGERGERAAGSGRERRPRSPRRRSESSGDAPPAGPSGDAAAPAPDWSPSGRVAEGGESGGGASSPRRSGGGGGGGRREPRSGDGGGGGSGASGGARPPRERGERSDRPARGSDGSRERGGSRRREDPPAPSAAKPAPKAQASASPSPNTNDGGDERTHLAGPLLTAVSRSFSISIKLLPEPLRGPISLGYLFARALDTIADSPAAPTPTRLGHLRAVLEMLKYGVDPAALRTLERELAPRQMHPGERELLGKLPALFSWMDALEAEDRWDLQRTLARIGYGQELDLRRFGGDAEGAGEKGAAIQTLERAEETQDYAYLVAGSAGEFWTRLCGRHLKEFAKLPTAEMLTLGRQLGQGLQLVNILRDLPRDLAAGRCYLPAEDLAAHGLSAEDLLKTPERARPLLAKWRAAAVEHLDGGWRYVQALQPSKLRYACALPVLLAVRTLALLAKTSPLETPEPVKVPRMALRQLMLTSAAASILAPRLLDRLYKGPRKAALEG